MKRVYMVLDYETYSECDLKKAGGFEYAKHASTEILCAAFRIGTRDTLATAPTRLLLPSGGDGDTFAAFYDALMNPEIHLVAHNAIFEQFITRYVYGARLMYKTPSLQKIPLKRWHCTAAMARSVGLPGALDDAAKALGLAHQKNMAGHRLMLKLAKPRKATKHNASVRHRDATDLQGLYDYCISDIDAEVELFLRLAPLPKREREFWILDQRINHRGFAVDRKLIKGALHLIGAETDAMDSTIGDLTDGALNSARQRDATLKFLQSKGVGIWDLKAATVESFLEKGSLEANLLRILEIRDAVSRSSTSKYQAFEVSSRQDGRIRDTMKFYGAHTGRGAGSRVQPQNLFKRVLDQKDVETGLGLIKAKDFHTVQALYAKPMELYASAIRSCIVAPKGMVLDVGDFATIEVRVLFWLAGNKKGLDALASGKDLYIDMAASIYSMPAEAIADEYKAGDIQRRQLGKATVLGAGFGMGIGGEKFQATAKLQYGLDIPLSMAQAAIRSYRERHPSVPAFWRNIEQGAKSALLNRGRAYKHGFLTWRYEGDFLTCELPIGRKLSYFKPKLERKLTLYGESTVLSYMGIDATTKQFVRQKTWGGKLAENATQAVARDLLMEAVALIEKTTSTRTVLTVHDEIVGERYSVDAETDAANHEAFLKAMETVPAWAKGIPVKVSDCWTSERYRK